MHAGLVYFKIHIVSRVISYATMLHLEKLFVDDRSNFCVRTRAPATSEAIAVRVVSGTAISQTVIFLIVFTTDASHKVSNQMCNHSEARRSHTLRMIFLSPPAHSRPSCCATK